MNAKYFLYAVAVAILTTIISWISMFDSSSNGHGGGRGGSSWSSSSGSYGSGSGGGHK
ncbi:hypothetical protein [Massilia violaceinigra]|uniref:hypothetical protein n=1 Tax=Massilia violaceinigra TaxID=2045208 RepID=UPI00142DCB30|nr:hypothetical protein [Massilia violaceinigra]